MPPFALPSGPYLSLAYRRAEDDALQSHERGNPPCQVQTAFCSRRRSRLPPQWEKIRTVTKGRFAWALSRWAYAESLGFARLPAGFSQRCNAGCLKDILKCFVRESPGHWTCVTPCELNLPGGRVQVAVGTRFTLGTRFMGVDIAKLRSSRSLFCAAMDIDGTLLFCSCPSWRGCAAGFLPVGQALAGLHVPNTTHIWNQCLVAERVGFEPTVRY